MAILSRLFTIFRADIHGVMDQLEDKQLMLKQCLRDMERELEKHESRLMTIANKFKHATCEHEAGLREIKKLEQDLNAAIKQDKDHIARLLIKKRRTLCEHLEHLSSHVLELEQDLEQGRSVLQERKLMYDQLKFRSEAYARRAEQTQWERTNDIMEKIHPYAEPQHMDMTLDAEVELELMQRKEALCA